MTAGLRLGDLTVYDQNLNNLYDPEFDLVTDSIGRVLSPSESSKGLNGVLKQLQVKSWKGILLSETSDYLSAFAQAKDHAKDGETEWASHFLQKAVKAAQNLSIPFDKKRADPIYREALEKGILARFQKSDEMAQKGGDIDSVKGFLDLAGQYDQALQGYFKVYSHFDRHRADQIMAAAYRNGIPRQYLEAFKDAIQGHLSMTKSLLQEIQRHITEANQTLQLGLSYDQDFAEKTLTVAYHRAISQSYDHAQQEARKGMTKSTRSLLIHTQSLIGQANLELNLGITFDAARADQILEVALVKGIEDNFERAEKNALVGKLHEVRYFLNLAEDYVNEYNAKFAPLKGRQRLTFDQAKSQEILKQAQNWSRP